MSKPTITEIENAFQPAKEVSGATRFAGRREAVSEAYYALIASGAHIAIVGNRGIGKTSLSRQILNIATGDNDLLAKLSLRTIATLTSCLSTSRAARQCRTLPTCSKDFSPRLAASRIGSTAFRRRRRL